MAVMSGRGEGDRRGVIETECAPNTVSFIGKRHADVSPPDCVNSGRKKRSLVLIWWYYPTE